MAGKETYMFMKVSWKNLIFSSLLSLPITVSVYFWFLQPDNFISKRYIAVAILLWIVLIAGFLFLLRRIKQKIASIDWQLLLIILLLCIITAFIIGYYVIGIENTPYNLFTLPKHSVVIENASENENDVIELIYFNSGLGDESLSKFVINGSWTRTENSLIVQGTQKASLSYEGWLVKNPALSFQVQPNGGRVNIYWDGRLEQVSLSSSQPYQRHVTNTDTIEIPMINKLPILIAGVFAIAIALFTLLLLLAKVEILNEIIIFARKKFGLYGLALVALFSSWVTIAAYILLMNIAYNPNTPIGGAGVFLRPRYMVGSSGVPSSIFTSWTNLFIFGSLSVLIQLFGFSLLHHKNLSFVKFLLLMYLLALGLEACFLSLTTSGFKHLSFQSQSMKNGIWYSINWLANNPDFAGHTFFEKLQYIFIVLCGNDKGYTIPGTTHPPGVFLCGIGIYRLAHLLPIPIAYGWGVIVSMLNTGLVVVVGLLSREIFSESTARRTCLMMLVVPSSVMNFCAVGSGIPALLVSLGALLLINALKYLQHLPGSKADSTKLFLYGLASGIAFTLTAQFSYGHIIPILALVISFNLLILSIRWREKAAFWAGLLIAPALYFIFEYIVSGGQSFYPIRALRIANSVKQGLAGRPYPLTQFANFVVMSIMGGFLFLPTLYFVFINFIKEIKRTITHLVLPRHSDRNSIRSFALMSTMAMLAFLLIQSTVRLEVERTFIWFFPFVWSLMGIFQLAFRVTARRLFPKSYFVSGLADWMVCALQLFVSIVLAMVIQDYY